MAALMVLQPLAATHNTEVFLALAAHEGLNEFAGREALLTAAVCDRILLSLLLPCLVAAVAASVVLVGCEVFD